MELLKREVTQWNQCPEFLQHEFRQNGEFIHTFTIKWIDLLKGDVTQWNQCPKFLRQEDKVIRARKTGWMELLKREVTQWNQCPEFLQQEVKVIRARKTGWMELVKRDVTQWNQCPEFLQQDDEVIQARKIGWIELFRRDVTNWKRCPDFLKKDEEVIRARKTGWIKALKRDGGLWNQCLDFLKKDEEIIHARKIGWIMVLKRRTSMWNQCPDLLKKDEEVIGALKNGWIKVLKREPYMWEQCPIFLKKDLEVIQALKVGWIHFCKKGQRTWRWREFPEILLHDVEMIESCKAIWFEHLKNDRTEWNKCPFFIQQELIRDADFTQIFKIRWIGLINHHANEWRWRKCPDFLMQDLEIVNAYKIAWKAHLESRFTDWNRCPDFLWQEFSQDAEFMQRFKRGWMSHIECNLNQWYTCPEFLKQDLEIIHAHKSGWEAHLKIHSTDWNRCPELIWQEFSQDTQFMQRFQDDFILRIKDDVNLWNQCPEFLKTNYHIIQAHKIGWMQRLKLHATNWDWNKCPDFLKDDFLKDRDFIQIVRTYWIELLQRNVTLWNQCPDFIQQVLKQDYSFISEFKNGWIVRLKLDVDQWSLCPEILREQAEVKNAFVQGEINWARSQSKDRQALWIQRLIERSLIQPEDLPTDMQPLLGRYQLISKQKNLTLPNDSMPAFVTACFNALLLEPQATLPIVKCWKHSPRIELARCAKALVALKEMPWNFIALSAEQQSHPLIQESAIDGWVDFVTKNPRFQSEVPNSLRGHQKIQTMLETLRKDEQAKHVDQILERVKTHSGLSDDEMSVLKLPTKEKQTWKQVTSLRLKHWKKQLKADARVWEMVPQSLQQHKDLLKLMREGIGPKIRLAPGLWEDLPECYRTDECLKRVHRFATRA
jgi:hypothetical protein